MTKRTPGFGGVLRSLARTPVLVALLLGFACGQPADEATTTAAIDDPAERLARETLIIDTHVDLPYRLFDTMEDITVETEGDFDLPRARRGGLDAPFMSIYVPAQLQESGGAKEHAEALIDMVRKLAADAPDDLVVATSPAQVEAAFAQGKIALPMGMENGAPIETLEDLAHFYDRGIRYITLTHSQNNQICDSSYAPQDQREWNGLSEFGREVVHEMNRLGIMVDVSHVSDDTFDQVLDVTRAPVIASHSSARHFTPGFERNMSDEMIVSLAENGGVIQINFGSTFIDEESNRQGLAVWMDHGAWLQETGADPSSPEAEAHLDELREANPLPLADVSDVADHIAHVVELVGIDHVGLGSDFDGVGPTLPVGLEDASKLPNLIRELMERGFSEDEIAKICSGNILRVWREVERIAGESEASETGTAASS